MADAARFGAELKVCTSLIASSAQKNGRLTIWQDGFKPVHAWVSYLLDCVDSGD